MAENNSALAGAKWVDAWASVLRPLILTIREIEKDRHEIFVTAQKKTEGLARFSALSIEAEWWRYYEMREWRHFSLALLHVGLLPDLILSILKGIRPQNFLSSVIENVAPPKLEPRSLKRAVGATWSLGQSLRSIVVCGESLNRLVARSRADSEALKLAIRIDPLTLFCKPIRQRIAQAVAEHDMTFMAEIGEALQNPKGISSEQYPELQFCLSLLAFARQLVHLNEARAEQLFLVKLADLKLYQSDRRSLIRFIQRFRDRAATQKR